MIINKFKAKTEKEALEMAKEELGDGAIVLNVKNIKPRGLMKLFKKPIVELTAAIDDYVPGSESSNKTSSMLNGIEKSNKAENVTKKTADKESEDNKYSFEKAAKEIAGDYSEEAQSAIEERINNIARLLEQQINIPQSTKENVKPDKEDVVQKKDDDITKKEDITEKKSRVISLIYDKLVENEVSEKYAQAVVSELNYDENKAPIDNALASVYQKIVLKLGKIEPLKYSDKKPKVVFFVGNTGVGKTTTMAKLASKCILEEKKRVALISVDTYRIAAIEQTKTYASILGAPMEVVYSPEEMVSCVDKYKDFDAILVDTAGRSHKNQEQKNDLKEIIDSVSDCEKEIYLVVSATVKYSDLLNIAKSYDDMFDYKLIFTKLDETSGLGCILNLKLDMDKSLSYVTFGQNVPEDMSVLNPQSIAKKLLGGGV